MSPDLVLFGIKALIRVKQQGDRAMIEYAADKPIKLPAAKLIELSDPKNLLDRFLIEDEFNHLTRISPFDTLWDSTAFGGGRLKDSWDDLPKREQDAAFLVAMNAVRGNPHGLAALSGKDIGAGALDAEQLVSQILIEQWKPDQKPISPFGRMILTVAEIGLEFLAADPSILGAGKSGDKIVKGFAEAITGPLRAKLDAATLGPQSQLANDLMSALVRAGLSALKSSASELVSDKHIAKLMENVLDPVIEAAKGDGLAQDRMQRILDALAGPAAAAAMKTVAENPAAFFGARLDGSKAVGALVGALLTEASKNGNVRIAFGDDGLLRLLAAALGVAAKTPGLFVKSDNKAIATLLTDLSGTLAERLKAHVDALAADQKVDGRALAAGIAAAAIETFAKNAGAISGGDNAWKELAVKVSTEVLGTFVTALRSGDGAALKRVLSEDKLVELAGIVVGGIAANPGMIGAGDAKVREVVGLLAKAMSGKLAENKSLLSEDDWLDLARAMVKELAARPSAIAGGDARLQAVVAALAEVVAGDKNALLKGGDITAIGRAILERVVKQPALLGGLDADVKNVALAVAAAMKADEKLLLSRDDWIAILDVAIKEAAANPGRLFGSVGDAAAQALAVEMTGLVLKAVTQIAKGADPKGLIVDGGVLREATLIVLRRTAGVPERVKTHQALLETAVREATAVVKGNPGQFGARAWLALIDTLTGQILDGKHDPLLTPGAVVTFVATVEKAHAVLKESAP